MVFTKNVAFGWLLLLGLLVGAPRLGQAQILDDTTKVLYGPKTTRIIREADLLRDSTRGVLIDTSLVRWSQQRFWFHDSTFQQDLGTVGSASRPLLYQPNLALGTRLGRNVFDKYARQGSRVPYYDSRSPYSFFRYIQSSEGEQVFEISYSRSLKKNFSIGADYERFASNKLLATNTNAGLVEHNAAMFFARYQTDDERYHLLVSLVNTRHRAIEQGGIQPLTIAPANQLYPSDLFIYDRAAVRLSYATNTDDRDQLRLFHSYRLLGRGVTAYHIFDIQRQYNGFIDTDLNTANSSTTLNDRAFFPLVLRNTDQTVDRTTYRQVENTVGLLGRTDRLEYNLYARHRAASLRQTSQQRTLNATTPPVIDELANTYPYQLFVGGNAAFNYRTIYAVEVAGEYKPAVDKNLSNSVLGEYWLRGRIRTGPLSAEVLTTSYSPTLTQVRFLGNHYQWNNMADSSKVAKKAATFSNTLTNQLAVRLQQRLPFLADHTLEASVTVVNLTNLIYYNEMGLPTQLTGSEANKQLLIGAARHRFRVGKVYFDNQATYTLGADSASVGLRIPKLVAESRIYYQTYVFKKALLGQVGVEGYYQSRFRGYGYSPSTQQFYVQNYFTIRDYAVANAFLTADIKAATIFLKVAYLNEGLDAGGYFTTPYYIAYPRRFQFGVRWRFFS